MLDFNSFQLGDNWFLLVVSQTATLLKLVALIKAPF